MICWWLLLLLQALINTALSDVHIRTLSGSVGAGNYTYYKLTQEGDIRLELTSIEGDADIYVSYLTLTPEYDNFEMKSATCGADQVEIENIVKRPVGIGIFGYPQYETSKFTLDVYLIKRRHTPSYSELAAAHSYNPDAPTSQETYLPNKLSPNENSEESLLWDVFITLLKIIFDILT